MPRIFYRRYLVVSVVFALLLIVTLTGSGSSPSVSPSSYGKNIQSLIAGAENGKKWQKWTEDTLAGSQLYSYLFDKKVQAGKGRYEADAEKSAEDSGSTDAKKNGSTQNGSKDGSKNGGSKNGGSKNGKSGTNSDKAGTDTKSKADAESTSLEQYEASVAEFVTEIFQHIFNLKPSGPSLEKYYETENGKIKKVDTSGMDMLDSSIYSINFLKNIIKVPREDVADLATKHAKFVEFARNAKSGMYRANTSGMVYVGGGRFTWFALLSIRNVRKTGSVLPIELFIPTQDEYEYVVCEEILPKLNARCVLMYDYLRDKQGTKEVFGAHEFKGFTYKSLALLLSSFENILLLDADNVPYYNPDPLFFSEPYRSSKLVVWPDYWQRSTSPYFYDIAGIDLVALNSDKYSEDEILNNITLHSLKGAIPNPSTESGQLMISKSKHWNTLLLSLYYNVYGPDHYYHLFSQGAAGQGDKETFLAAATVLNASFYQVTSKVSAIGYWNNGEYRGTAQGQKSPIEDYEAKNIRTELKKVWSDSDGEEDEIHKILGKFINDEDVNDEESEKLAQLANIKTPSVFFIHESTPKLDPITLIHNKEFINEKGGDKDSRVSFYANYITKKGNYRFEKLQMEYIYDYLCERKLVIRFIEEQVNNLYVNNGEEFDKEDFCKKLDDQVKWLGEVEWK